MFSLDHPFSRTVNPETLKLKQSYFKIGKLQVTFSDPTKKFVIYTHSISGLHNTLVKAGLIVEKILEPDSRKRYKKDPWYNMWDYKPKYMKMFPPTIIFKSTKP